LGEGAGERVPEWADVDATCVVVVVVEGFGGGGSSIDFDLPRPNIFPIHDPPPPLLSVLGERSCKDEEDELDSEVALGVGVGESKDGGSTSEPPLKILVG